MKYLLSESAARKLARLTRPGMSESRRIATSSAAIDTDAFALPFAVRWSASTGDNGAWIVWLPSLSDLVTYSGAALSIGGVAAAGGDLPAGWYTVEDAQEAIYLVITVDDESGAASADLSAEPGTAATGETVYNLLVATMSTDAATTAKSVRQYIVGAIALGGSGSGTDVTVRNPSNLVADIEEMPTDPSAEGYESGHEGDFKITFGNLKIGDGQGGTTKGEIYINLGEAGYIPARRIVAGDNIHINVQGKNIIISADVESTTEGFTGSRTVLFDTDYDPAYHQLKRRYATETWVDGLLQQTVVGEWEAYTTAVEETVVTPTN